MKKVCICIPTYNEAENIGKLLGLIKNQIALIPNGYEIGVIVIDDNSPDKTGEIVEKYKDSNPDFDVQIIHNPGKAGLGKAYIQGFKKGIELGAFAVMEMDADFSHDPKYLPEMIKHLDHFDLVIGSRYVKNGGTLNWDTKRKLISFGGNLYSRMILMKNIHDFTGGFNLYKTDVFKKVDLGKITSNGYSFQIELKYKTLQQGFTYKEIPIIFKDREFGKSKFSGGIIKEAIKKPWKLRLGLS